MCAEGRRKVEESRVTRHYAKGIEIQTVLQNLGASYRPRVIASKSCDKANTLAREKSIEDLEDAVSHLWAITQCLLASFSLEGSAYRGGFQCWRLPFMVDLCYGHTPREIPIPEGAQWRSVYLRRQEVFIPLRLSAQYFG